MKRIAYVSLAGVMVLALSPFAQPRPAQACGGFFCNQVPVEQSGEQIVFAITPNHVTAYIQISYAGNANDFAWVVPVMAKPTFSLGPQAVFTALTQRTQPQFRIEWPQGPGGQCSNQFGLAGGAPTSAPGAAADNSVNIVDSRELGPFEIVVVESKSSVALLDWLNKNKFDQPPGSLPLIEQYVKKDFLFVALRLMKDASTGEIQPLVLDMDTPEACVPLVLTRIAAQPDMPVTVYALGSTRATPRNWFEVQINPKKIDWLRNGSNYRQVATAAIDEAAGHGFITEYAGRSDIMQSALYRQGQFDLTKLRTITNPQMFLQAIFATGLPRDQTMMGLLRKYLPMPQVLIDRKLTEQQFYNGVLQGQYKAELGTASVDAPAFIAALDMRVIEPLKQAQAMFDKHSYLTRMFATVSPPEMTRDPLFHFNKDMPMVSNIHRALATGSCGSDGLFHDVKLIFENQESVTLPQPVRPFGPQPAPWTYAMAEPAAYRISLAGPVGEPTVYTRGQAKIVDGYLDTEAPESVRVRKIAAAPNPMLPGSGDAGGGPVSDSMASGCACTAGAGHSGGAGGTATGLALGLVALVAGRRRNRNRVR